jgi:hypothetical protein
MDYNSKYLKYKLKYLNLKKLLGGGKLTNLIKGIVQMFKKPGSIPINILQQLFEKDSEELKTNFNDYQELLAEITSDNNFKRKKITLKTLGMETTFEKYLEDINIEGKISDEILDFFKIKKIRICSVEELMTLENVVEDCKNLTAVTGSCGDPSFLKTNTDISEEYKDKWIELLTSIESKLNELKYIDFVIGATERNYSDFKSEKNNLTLCISPIATNEKFDVVITEIKSTDSLLDKNYRIYFLFPLSHNFPNSKIVLDKILDLNKKVRIRITNRMCGSCFRSLYYLVKNGIEYSVSPEQGLDDNTDTPAIRRCFK